MKAMSGLSLALLDSLEMLVVMWKSKRGRDYYIRWICRVIIYEIPSYFGTAGPSQEFMSKLEAAQTEEQRRRHMVCSRQRIYSNLTGSVKQKSQSVSDY